MQVLLFKYDRRANSEKNHPVLVGGVYVPFERETLK